MPQALSGSINETTTYLQLECKSVEQRYSQVFKNLLLISLVGFVLNLGFFLTEMPGKVDVTVRIAFYLTLAISCRYAFASMMNCGLSLKSMQSSQVSGAYTQLPSRMVEFLHLAAGKSSEQVASAYMWTLMALSLFAFANFQTMAFGVILILIVAIGSLAKSKISHLVSASNFEKVSDEAIARYQEKIALILMS
mmetsp:Transcript_63938/g.73347  ORF Transcript_63938/g.73347 Transcript_63938/m.73347 type:complete len:194 (+) Transcript_63938:266-847(+)